MKLTEVIVRINKLQDAEGIIYNGEAHYLSDGDKEALEMAEKIIASIIPEEDEFMNPEKDSFGEEAKQIAVGGQAVPTEDRYTVIQSGPVNMTIKNDGVMDITL